MGSVYKRGSLISSRRWDAFPTYVCIWGLSFVTRNQGRKVVMHRVDLRMCRNYSELLFFLPFSSLNLFGLKEAEAWIIDTQYF